MHIVSNARHGDVPALAGLEAIPDPSTDVAAVAALLARCPAAAETPLLATDELARAAGVAALHVKDERGRMGLGSFKALGAAYVIACDAVATGAEDLKTALGDVTYVTASAGNHGLSVAAGAGVFGARAVVHLADTVPEAFADRLREKGAEVVRSGADYEASMAAAERAAEDNGWRLLSDSSWPGYTTRPWRLMEGYLALMDEAIRQMPAPPTHLLLQAGVGGLAGAAAALARAVWGERVRIVVVEPAAAPALQASIAAGRPVETPGPVSSMGRLDCKAPSLIALKGLARDADAFVTLEDAEVEAHLATLAAAGLATTPSGGAGLAALLAADAEARAALGLGAESRVLAIVSEEAGP
ncbi:pyridoxal-phosphate dependent enzyme [Stappia sp.]|uniref:pyridoxal-phosphate dependent enzyme n=1 Tax=Stappia sp. TaxID=1870903 RepID=UPI0032D8C3E2